MQTQIQIETGARLHCGFFAHGNPAGRQFGGVGWMIDRPGFLLRGRSASRDEATGTCVWSQRIAEIVAHYRRHCPPDRQPPPVRWELRHSPPAHAGLGSGTQLGLAVAQTLSLLADETDVSAAELARRSGRGARSAIGLYGFHRGGLLVEGGKLCDTAISPLLMQASLPNAWRIVLIRPRAVQGLSGNAERQGFAQLGSLSGAATDTLCRLALLQLVPAAIEARFDEFADALYEFGRLTGEYFAPIQGGTYAEPRMRELVPLLRARGYHGVGQSSWGPTLFALCSSLAMADSLVSELSQMHLCTDCELTIAAPLNRGATITVVE